MKRGSHGAGGPALPLLAAGLVLAPLIAALWASGLSGQPLRWPGLALLVSTCAWSGGVALVALLLGVPGAMVVAARGARAAPIVLTPLLLPSYFAYSGLTLLRAPGTPLGDALARLSAAGDTAPAALAGRVTAALALSLWGWPLASLALGAYLRRTDSGVIDALRMDAPAHRRFIEHARMAAPGCAGAWLLVFFVMLGSAVPFHLAQVKTSAIIVWLELQQTAQPVRAWVAAWPVLAAGLLCAWILSGVISRSRAGVGAERRTHAPAGRAAYVGLSLAWCAGIGLPFVLYCTNLAEFRALSHFWSLCGPAVLSSAGVACAVGVVVALITVLTGAALGEPRTRSPVRLALFVLLGAGLAPGILVGSAWSVLSMKLPAWLGDSAAMVVCAHVARFAFVGILGGAIIAAGEARELAEARRLEGATGVVGWLAGCGRANAELIGACAVGAAALSFHEIEASVLVRPPGMESLAQRLLNDLHQLRMDAMSAAAIWLTLMGLAAALGAGWLVARWSGRR